MRTLAIILALLGVPCALRAETDRTTAEQTALTELFAERHIADAALVVHRRAMTMPAAKRFDYLRSWVLPGPDHSTLRLALDYTPTNPAPPVADHDPLDECRLQMATTKRQSRVQTGGQLVSPALDLIEAARRLGRLDELRREVQQLPAGDKLADRSRLAMLALIDIVREDSAAVDHLLQLFALVERGKHTKFAERWPETLAVDVGLRHPPTREVARDLALHLYFRQTRSGVNSGSEVWRRQMVALVGLAKRFEIKRIDTSIESFTAAPDLSWWHPVSRITDRSRGLGYPASHWQRVGDRADCIATHDEEFLYYCSPLSGDFEIECDLPAFDWRAMQVVFGGRWAAVNYDVKTYALGGIRGSIFKRPIAPALTPVSGPLHVRLVAHGGKATTYVNGHLIHQEPRLPGIDPWLSIRNNFTSTGSVRNVRIMGQPQVPEEVKLNNVHDLREWYSYYQYDTVGNTGTDWRLADATTGGILGMRRTGIDGFYLESLLRYHRPMFEDGTIAYEFFYREGESHCHPAMDRLALLLTPQGVRVHWLTDGRFDRTDLTADNAFDEPACRRGPAPLPLLNDAWNSIAVTLQGNTLQVSLNGQPIYERPIEATNQRTFGLFYYSDQTEARVRNLTWRGDWPREVPVVPEQELTGDGTKFLYARLPDLTAEFSHDFARHGFDLSKFAILEGAPGVNFIAGPDGLHANRVGKSNFLNATISPRLMIHGDFDITVQYDRYQAALSEGGTSSIILRAKLENAAEDEFVGYHRAAWSDAQHTTWHVQSAHVHLDGGEPRRAESGSTPFEADGGTLRLARRGDKLHFLVAERDSPNFRVISTKQIAADDLPINGLRISAQIKGPGRVDVILKGLTIRAERLDFRPPAQDTTQTLTKET